MKKSAPCIEYVFEHTLKMSPRLNKNYIHNHVTGHLLGLHINICPLGVKDVEIQWMGSALHRPSHINPRRCSIDGKRSPLPLLMSTKKRCSTDGERFLCGMSSNWILASCKFFSLTMSPKFKPS